MKKKRTPRSTGMKRDAQNSQLRRYEDHSSHVRHVRKKRPARLQNQRRMGPGHELQVSAIIITSSRVIVIECHGSTPLCSKELGVIPQ
jgi:hypothetical protein